jgi:hypothetical protein
MDHKMVKPLVYVWHKKFQEIDPESKAKEV